MVEVDPNLGLQDNRYLERELAGMGFDLNKPISADIVDGKLVYFQTGHVSPRPSKPKKG